MWSPTATQKAVHEHVHDHDHVYVDENDHESSFRRVVHQEVKNTIMEKECLDVLVNVDVVVGRVARP
ncbi:MAG TPA: hypothetical protein VGL91_05740 [Acidobacteriota bacterium]|jgi:hypothetical protein